MSDQMLPPEYQSQIDAFRKKQMLAQLLQKQGLNPQMAQSQGRMAARTSPLSFLSSALSAYVGTQADAKADQGISGVKQKYATDAQGAIDQFLKLPEGERDTFAAKTPFIPVKEIAKAFAERQQKAIEAGAAIAGKVDPNAGLGMLRSGQFPATPVQPRAVKPSEEGTLSDGTRFVRDFDADGKPTTRLVRPPMQINNIPATGEKAAIVALGGSAPKIAQDSTAKMESAVDVADKADRIRTLAMDPTVITGFGADPARFLASLATKLNLTGPEGVAKTQALLSSIAEQTLDASIDLKGAITEKEWPRLAQARAGEISYTPSALQELAYIAKAKAHNQYVRAARQRNALLNIAGGDQVIAAFPAPSYEPGEMPANLFRTKPDGTVQYTGSIDNILQSNNAAGPVSAGPRGLRYNPTTKQWEVVK